VAIYGQPTQTNSPYTTRFYPGERTLTSFACNESSLWGVPMSLALRNLLFTVIVLGSGAVYSLVLLLPLGVRDHRRGNLPTHGFALDPA
jgi:hypothetical protein